MIIIDFLEKISENRSTALSRPPWRIAEAVGLPQQKVRAILVEMVNMGIVERRTRGKSKKGYPARSFYRIRKG
jgi:predicted ArsR family transcriptional regulator